MNESSAKRFAPAGKGEIFSWCCFDFANSAFTTVVVTVVFSIYFTKIICAGRSDADWLWGLAILVSQVLVVAAGPVLGALADLKACKKKFLFATYATCVGATWCLSFAAPGAVALAWGLFVVANIAFSLGENFCASFLPELASDEDMGRVSGFGWSFGYLGGLLSLLLCFPLIKGGFVMENLAHLQMTNQVTAAFFGVAAIPTFLFLRERALPQAGALGVGITAPFVRLGQTLKGLPHDPLAGRFFISFFCYTAGLSTVIAYAAIYAEREVGFAAGDLLVFFLILQVSSCLGAFLFGFFQDKFGSVRTLEICLLVWIVVVLLAFFIHDKILFYVVGNLAGLAIGSTQSASRALVGLITPENRQAEYFGLWGFFGKLSAGLGAISFGIVSTATDSIRWALLSTVVFFIAGAWLLRGLKLPAKRVKA